MQAASHPLPAQTESSFPRPRLSTPNFFFPPKVIPPNKFCLKIGLGTGREGLALYEMTRLGAAEIFCYGSVSPSPCHAPAPPGHVTTLARRAKAASDGHARWPGEEPRQVASLPACLPGQNISSWPDNFPSPAQISAREERHIIQGAFNEPPLPSKKNHSIE